MSDVHFDYEIPPDEYVAAQLLYRKLHDRERRRGFGATWILCGAVFVVMAFNGRPPEWAPIGSSYNVALLLLAGLGISWILAGIRVLFPARYIRRSYRKFEFAGKSFKTDVNELGFQVEGEFHGWRVEWPGVTLKGEDKFVFIFASGGTLFIFGKKFLNAEQQDALRTLSGLVNA